MQLRGVGTVDWSAADKKYVVSGFTASTLNLAAPWAAPPVSVETPSGSESDKPGDAGTEDADLNDLKGNGGASSSVPALSIVRIDTADFVFGLGRSLNSKMEMTSIGEI